MLCGLFVEKWQCLLLGGQKDRKSSVETWLDSVMQDVVADDDDVVYDGTSVVMTAVMWTEVMEREQVTAAASYCCDDAGLLLQMTSSGKVVDLFLDYVQFHQSTV